MKTPLIFLALVGASLAPLPALAQNNTPPGYTFNGGMFPNMFGNNGYNGYTLPQGYMNRGQSPFLTMPAPQYPFVNPQFPNGNTQPYQAAPFPANPMAQPTPFWMQTPANPQAPARYITDIPPSVRLQNTPPNYTVFNAPVFHQSSPPRWAPLPGQGPVVRQPQRPINNWSIFPNGRQPAPVVPATPSKWPTP